MTDYSDFKDITQNKYNKNKHQNNLQNKNVLLEQLKTKIQSKDFTQEIDKLKILCFRVLTLLTKYDRIIQNSMGNDRRNIVDKFVNYARQNNFQVCLPFVDLCFTSMYEPINTKNISSFRSNNFFATCSQIYQRLGKYKAPGDIKMTDKL